ncbi:thiamine phosphate synthase, partial [Escherichia coli]|nr:thiamine phosphate synthase [Escherichia coli]
MLHLSRIYPITDTALSGCTHAELVSEFAAAGASLVQIRDKKASPREFYRNAAEAVLTGRRLGV